MSLTILENFKFLQKIPNFHPKTDAEKNFPPLIENVVNSTRSQIG